jgi:adenylate cyclase
MAFARELVWLDATFTTAAMLLTAGFGMVSRVAVERRLRRRAQRQRANISQYISPVIAGLLAESETAAFVGREQQAAILFVDMAGFTRRAEQMAPAETARFLREFHRHIESVVLAHRGVLEQFTGDGAMVIFGVPKPSADDAASALACARALWHGIQTWSAELAAGGQAPLRIRIGVHYGPVAIASLGGDTQRHITAAGDTVNVASRLEALSGTHGAAIGISSAAVAAVCSAGRPELLAGFRELPPQPIRGRDQPIALWIAGPADLGAPSPA